MDKETFLKKLEKNTEEDLNIMRSKNKDYADEETDPFKNFRMVQQQGLCTVEMGLAVRISDKVSRIFNLVSRDEDAEVDDETLEDTLSDLRNYANILQVYIENEKE